MPDLAPPLPTSAVDPLAAECALASIGLKNVLDGDPSWDLLHRKAAADLPKVAKKLLSEFISGGDRRDTEPLPPFNYKKVGQLLAVGPLPKHAIALQEAINDPKLALAVSAVASRITHQLQDAYPRRTRTTSQGTVPDMASPTDQADFARLWSVACDPKIVLMDLVEGSLSPDMVRGLETLWPNIYLMIATVAQGIVANIRAKRPPTDNRPAWELDSRRDRMLGILMGNTDSNSDLSLAADFQALSGAKAQASPAPSSRPINFKTDLGTPGQAD